MEKSADFLAEDLIISNNSGFWKENFEKSSDILVRIRYVLVNIVFRKYYILT